MAWHESAHALLGLLLPEADPVQKVTIVPRGQALGSPGRCPRTTASTTPRPTCGRASPAPWAAARGGPGPRAPPPPGPRTTCSRPPPWPARWSPAGACPPGWACVHAAREDGGFRARPSMPDLGSGVSDELAAIMDEETKRITDECYAVAEGTLRRERWRLEALATALLERGVPGRGGDPPGHRPPGTGQGGWRAPRQGSRGGSRRGRGGSRRGRGGSREAGRDGRRRPHRAAVG